VPRGNNMGILQYIFSLCFVSPPPPPLAPSNPQPPDNPKPSEPKKGILYLTDQMRSTLLYISLIHHSLALIVTSWKTQERTQKWEDHQSDHDDGNTKIGASDNSFDSGMEPQGQV